MAHQKFQTTYVSKPTDEQGYAQYTPEEDSVWHDLITRQTPIVQKYACQEYLRGLELLNLPHDRMPQCPEVTQVLKATTGWSLQPVPALIPADYFFELLAQKKFPAATFIRRREEIDYVQEPDLFHELFGHGPLLTNQAYADFTHNYGRLSLKASEEDREMLARLYWFTIEFGLIKTLQGIKVYGGGILSSKTETPYSIDSPIPERRPFTPLDALRTPYRIDILQPVYYVINEFNDLFHVIDLDLHALIKQARQLGMYAPTF